jgi:putative FmdB family regulatory protein
MPIYSYECQEHGEFEKLITLSESDKDQECPMCKEHCHRVFSASGGGFQLKGDWFKTSGKY